jgi:peptidoglycan/xylan/chitin deacetylase (PgdA/CDA1 family)
MTVTWSFIVSVGGLAILIFATVVADFGIGHVLRRMAERRLRRQARGKLVLTYDDGPYSMSIVEELVNILKQHDGKATFFLLGWRADEQPKQCEHILKCGHVIASHTQNHVVAWRNPILFVFDMLRGARAVEKYSRGSRWFRPPNGKMDLLAWCVAWNQALRPVFWTVDAKDAYFQNEPEYRPIEEVLQEVRKSCGAVVLLHDHHRESKPENCQRTLELTRRLLELARQERLEVVSVEALAE